MYVLFFKFSWYFLLLLFSALDEGDIALLKTYVSTMHVHRYLDLRERLELPGRPPKYRNDQKIIGKY